MNSAYQTEFDRVISSTDSDFQKEILSDCEVTDAEYDAARQRVRECVKAAGITVQFSDHTGCSSRELKSQMDIQSDFICNTDSLMGVESLYWSPQINQKTVVSLPSLSSASEMFGRRRNPDRSRTRSGL